MVAVVVAMVVVMVVAGGYSLEKVRCIRLQQRPTLAKTGATRTSRRLDQTERSGGRQRVQSCTQGNTHQMCRQLSRANRKPVTMETGMAHSNEMMR